MCFSQKKKMYIGKKKLIASGQYVYLMIIFEIK